MSTTLIFGGSGKVARLLTRLLVSRSHTVHSVIRSASQADSLTALGAHPIVQSLEDASVDVLTRLLQRVAPSVVVWAAGAGGTGGPARTDAVDRAAALTSMRACAAAGVPRYVMVSAMDMRDRGRPAPAWYDDADRARSDAMWAAIGPYCAAKLAADRALVTGEDGAWEGLRWTIVRPGALTDEAGTGRVAAGKVHITRSVAREDVAAVLAACVEDEGTAGCVFDVVGGDEAVADAVKRIAREKVNTFDGYY